MIFSRAIIGREIKMLKRLFPSKIIFVYDARAVAAEENRYSAIKTNDFRNRRFQMIGKIFYLEYQTIKNSDLVFSVSKNLISYFKDNFKSDQIKYELYPCLSSSEKFYFNSATRNKIRKEMNFSDKNKVFIYAGGIAADWHMVDAMMFFYRKIQMFNSDSIFLFLSNDEDGFKKTMLNFPDLANTVHYKNVPNNEVYKYLNAADFGLLFRENTIMNNVSSPTKFAEYILCGLPVLISDGVGDYSNFVKENNVGFVLDSEDLCGFNKVDFNSILTKDFNRTVIAQFGEEQFSKESMALNLVSVLKDSEVNIKH